MTATEVELIHEGQRFARTWGALCGAQHYRADVEVAVHGNVVPPPWLQILFADPAGDGVLTAANFAAYARPHLALSAAELTRVALEPVTAEEYVALQLETVDVPSALSADDFAGPQPPRRRKRGRRR